MPTASLPALEQRLEACLLQLEKTHLSRPSLPTAMARAEAGRRVDELYEQMVELQEQIDARPMRLLSGALEAVERAAEVA